MEVKGIKFRYINFACYEVILPNGKEIVIDPCHTMNTDGKKDAYMAAGSYDIPVDWCDYKGADYVLISHTHGDHTLDLGYLVAKTGFDWKAESLGDIAILCDLPAHTFTITVKEWEGPVTFEITI